MKILVTGAKGFIGKNLICELKNQKYDTILEYDIDSDENLLDTYTENCDFVFHLAGINRTNIETEYFEGNFGFTSKLLSLLEKHNNHAPVLYSSSIQASLNNTYGKSKKASEQLIFDYGKKIKVKTLVYRLPNVFGKWCKPNYNSVVATFCHNIANGLPINVNEPDRVLNLVYIDDVVSELINALNNKENCNKKYCEVSMSYTAKLSEIAELINSFNLSRKTLSIPNISDGFVKKLYSTYLSYLPKNQFSYPLSMNIDDRGSFSEIFRTAEKGQISVNIIKPDITKGNHWHNTKTEKFIVVSGRGVIKFKKLGSQQIIEYSVSGEKLEVVDVPVGYTHNIKNVGTSDLVVLIWCNECFNIAKPDTYFLEV